LTNDERGQIAPWLIKLAIFFLLGGLVLVESASIALAHYSTSEAASGAASQAAFSIKSHGVNGGAAEVAAQVADEKGCRLVSVVDDPATRTITVKMRKVAHTFVVYHIGPLKKFTIVTATRTSSYA